MPKLVNTLAFVHAVALLPSTVHATVKCTGNFGRISASEYVAAINPGWNLGNTLDSIPDEGSWNNAPVQAETFADIKAAGFKSVRIPVTYADHYVGSSPSWEIDPKWLQRVSDVVDSAVDAGLYVLTNVHHGLQISETLGCQPSSVAFEPINEPPIETAEQAAELNKVNGLFLEALKVSGGFNSERVVTLVGGSSDSIKTSQWFEAPKGYDNPWALQYHYYSPYDFIFSAWGKTILSDADIAAIESDLENIRGNFTGVPLVIGEFDASPSNTEPASRRKYMDVVVQKATELDTAVIVWDNGLDHFNRNTKQWRDPQSVEILLNAAAGVRNSLATFTTDASATEQSSSTYIFHKVGDEVTDQTISIALNGNTLESITTKDGTELSAPIDYHASDGNITFSSSFLSNYFSVSGSPGIKASLMISFSAGATASVNIVQWDIPVLGSTSSTAVSSADLHIPVAWTGLNQVSAVKMVRSDSVYLFDDWTRYLGPLQAGYGTWNGQWNWDDSGVILTAATVNAVIAVGVPTTFTFDFFPRVPGNSVNYTLNV
ncbi:putative cellulase [Xylaria bambusicola]|uniref:putative cellulase n=1 Tax=Xylaria bambusicola TaxID=326684 RepID=UPI0020086718|nr:putative cellulase [Xylaria bambusicola]KAI0520838.1 putative cellulase [Xylaria bambusicola]